MLGNGATLPGDCKLASGNLDKTTIKATYACPSGDVVVELTHPDAAPTNATHTEKFALRVERGTPPADLQSVLLSRIREREGQFHWTVYTAPTNNQATPVRTPFGELGLSHAMLFGLLVLALLLWRRRTAATRK